jgi:hypothetical protein
MVEVTAVAQEEAGGTVGSWLKVEAKRWYSMVEVTAAVQVEAARIRRRRRAAPCTRVDSLACLLRTSCRRSCCLDRPSPSTFPMCTPR